MYLKQSLLTVIIILSCLVKAEIDVLRFQSFQFKKQTGPAFISEGQKSVYTVLMDGPPDSDVTLELATTVDGYIKTLTEKLTFNSTNWNESREIYILGIDDDIIRYSPYGGILNINSTSSNSSYTAAANLTLLVSDTDNSGVVIVRKETYPFPTDIPEGRWAVYEVTLPSKPTHTVTITFHTLTSEISLGPTAMSFEPEAWDTPQDLVVYAIEDAVNMDSPYPASFNMSLESADTNYNEQYVPDYNVTIEDNDEDEAVIGGSLVWRKVTSGYPRTKAEFTLSLGLSMDYYSNVTVGSHVSAPGKLMFGDEIEMLKMTLTVKMIDPIDRYFLAEGIIQHEYKMANNFGQEWEAVYEYCCRSKTLRNNKNTKLALSVTVDLTYSASPLVPSLVLIHWSATKGTQYLYYPSLAPLENSIIYSFGNFIDYRSVQSGPPQGLDITPVTGHMTWNTDHVTPGDYSVQIVSKDIATGLRVATEVKFRLTQTYQQPTLPHIAEPIPKDNVYVLQGSNSTTSFLVTGGQSVTFLTPKPDGIQAYITTENLTSSLTVTWDVSSTQPQGPIIVCLSVVDLDSVYSPPACLSYVVTSAITESFTVDFSGPLVSGNIFHQSYVHGNDTFVPLTSLDVTCSLPLTETISHMTLFFATFHDGVNETLKVLDYSHPSLTIVHKPSADNSKPQILLITGEADVSVYLTVLQHVYYGNIQYQPTVGNRLVSIKMFNGQRINSLIDTYINISLSLYNIKPTLSVSGTTRPYFNRFFPHNGPVPAISPSTALLADNSSIQMATLELHNPLNGRDEYLQVTYESPEALSLPIIKEELNLNLPFGRLFSGEDVPELSHSLYINESGMVGDVDVIVDIRHSWIGDLKLELEHAQRRVLLVLSPGGRTCSRDNLFATTFDTGSSSNVTLSKSTSSPGLCRFQTQGLFTSDQSLQSFAGEPIEGEWTLKITDLLTRKDNGRLVSWGLVIRPQEPYLVVSDPPVVPAITTDKFEERHYRNVMADGRIKSVSVNVHLAIPFTAAVYSYLPTLKLRHPDGTEVILSDSKYPLCAYGNFSYVIFDDGASFVSNYTDYSCLSLYTNVSDSSNISTSNMSTSNMSTSNGSDGGLDNLGSGSGSSLGSASGSVSGSASDSISGSASGSISGSGSGSVDFSPDYFPTLEDIINLNITIPIKENLINLLVPRSPLSRFQGKRPSGRWTLIMSSDSGIESTLVGWTLLIAREPNIDHQYNPDTSTLTLVGDDSSSNYQTVLQSIVYNNVKQWPNFSESRHITTTVYDSDWAHSNSTQNQSQSYITVHHIEIDLDPFNATDALPPNFATNFKEHSPSIQIVDPSHAILKDNGFQYGIYSLKIILRNYSNHEMEGVTVNSSSVPELTVTESIIQTTDEYMYIVNISSFLPLSIDVFQTILRTAEYFNNAEELLGDSRIIEFQLQDYANGNRFISAVAIANISFIFVNDLPVLILNPMSPGAPYVVSYTEGEGAVLLTNDSLLNLTDNDDTLLQSLTITISNPFDKESEILAVDEDVLMETEIEANYNLSSNTLMLTGEDTLENYTSVLYTVTYNNTKHSPGKPDPKTRVVTFVPYDGEDEGIPAVTLISFTSVNDAPFGDLNGLRTEGVNKTVIFMEERGNILLVDPDAVLMDVDNVTLSYLTARIVNAFDKEMEVLSVKNVSERAPESNDEVVVTLNYFPKVFFDVEESTLTVSGLDTVYEYQEVLKTLVYNNVADEPNPTTRMIEIILNDGLVDSIPLYSIVEIELVNDSPYFDDKAPPFNPQIYEDVPDDSNVGVGVSEMAYLILDDDWDSIPGIAIIGTDTSKGQWQYSLSNSDWINIESNVSLTYALVLSASGQVNDSIRFVPDQDTNGPVSFVMVAWDSADGYASGSYIDATSFSDIDSFSSHSLKITFSIIPINDAPVLHDTPLNMTTILEDNYNSSGDTVLSLLVNAYDVDIPLQQNELGIAVVATEEYNGVWEYTKDGGITWTRFGEVNQTSPLLLESLPEELHRVRFVPHKDFNGLATFWFHAWDLTYEEVVTSFPSSGSASGLNSGSGSAISGSASGFGSGSGSAISGSASGFGSGSGLNLSDSNSPYTNVSLGNPLISINSTSVTIFVEPVNDSPVIRAGMTMMPIKEDLPQEMNHGTQISSIINDYYIDVDANPDKGLAIIKVDNRYGTWQYTCSPNIASSWKSFIGDIHYGQYVPPLPLVDKATLLMSSCWIRFLPDIHFNTEFDYNNAARPSSDTPYIVAYGWDNTGSTEGQSDTYGNDATYADTSITNEYSNITVTIPITITTVNDVPILHLTNESVTEYNTVFYEDLPSIPAVGKDLTLIDNDHSRLVNVTIVIHGEYTVSPFNETEVSNFIAAVMEETSVDMIVDNSTFSGSGNESGSGDISGSGSGLNDTTMVPVALTYIDYLQLYVQNKTNPTPEELYCAGLNPRREELFIDTLYTDLVTEITSWCPFTVIIYPNPLYNLFDTDKFQFQKVLRTVRYNNSIQEPLGGDRMISFVVSDGIGENVPVNTTIEIQLINDAPILDINDYIPDINNYVVYAERDDPLVLVNSSGLRLVDFDNKYLQNATIILIEAPDTVNETLTADVTGTNIDAEYINYTLYLTGNDTVEAYANVLSTVTYYNNYSNPGNPDQSQRQVVFYVSDGEKESSPAVSYITFIGVNDRPSIDVNGEYYGREYRVKYREEEGPVSIVSPYTILTDEDNSTLEYITARITNPLDMELEFLEVDPVVLQNVLAKNLNNLDKVVEFTYLIPNVSYNSTTATLYISGLDTVSEYKLILKTITYDNVAEEIMSEPRLVEFIASDGLLESIPSYTTIEMIPINDSPFFNDVTITVPHIYEDDIYNGGVTVESFASQLIEDYDSQYQNISKGIAVIETDITNGQWQFRLSPTGSWETFRSDTSITYATLLSATSDNSVRFVPNKDFNGNVSMTFVAWDGVDGSPDGHVRVALSNSTTDPFSQETRVLTIVVVPVNDAPVLNTSATVVFPPILEDDVRDRPSEGEDISILLSALENDVDQDVNEHEFGVAIVEADQSHGFWQFSTNGGVSWKNISSSLSVASSVVLHSTPSGQNRIRFAPELNYNGNTSLKFKLWDLNTSYVSGQEDVSTLTNPITGTFSQNIGTATLDIEPVNDSPVLTPGATFSTINEDLSSTNNLGTYVQLLVHFVHSDVDDGGEIGVAVVGIDRRYGEWQYTCDNPLSTIWLPFIGDYQFGQIAPREPNEQRATLLLNGCRIRFVPSDNFNSQFDATGAPRPSSDMPYIKIRGWDNTGATRGLNGRYGIDTVTDPDDHTNSFSEAIQFANITVVSVNDRPVLNISGLSQNYETTFTETYPTKTVVPVYIVDDIGLSLTDVDNANLTSVQVSFALYDIGEETLLVNVTDTSVNYSVVIAQSQNQYIYALRIVPVEGTYAPIEDFQKVLRTLRYQNTAEEPSPQDRIFYFSARDFESFSSLSRTTLHIQLVNDPPVIDLNSNLNESYNFVYYSEGQGPAAIIDSTLILTDNDNTSLESVSVTITNRLDGVHESLLANSTGTNITVEFNNGTLILEGPAEINEFINVLLTISYNNSLSHPGSPSDETRIIEIITSDGLNQTAAAVYLFFTAVNNKPILDVNGNETGFDFHTTFYEQEGPVSVVSEDTVLIDVDNETLSYILVVIENSLDGENEQLWVRNVTEYIGNPLGLHYSVWNFRPKQYYNATNSTLIISGLETVYEYQQVLRTLRYNNSANEPNNETRLISFYVSDGLSILSNVHSTIDIVNINDSPYINFSAPLYFPTTYEDIDAATNVGWSLEDIASNLILDDDANSIQGIAVIHVDSRYGHWEYTTNYQSTKQASGSGFIDSIMSALGLSGSGDSESVSGSTGSGSAVLGSAGSGSAVLSSAGSGSAVLGSAGSGSAGSGSAVLSSGSGSTMLGGNESPFGTTWHKIPNNSSLVQATVLRVNGQTTRIRFVPLRDFNGNVTMSFVAWDATDELIDGAITDATSRSRTDPYSSNIVLVTALVSSVNDAPLLTNETIVMTTILEDELDSAGNDIANFIVGVTDVDIVDTVYGIAIIGADDNGIWQYTIDGGSNWITILSPSLQNAVLLSSQPSGSNRLRLLPNKDYNGYSNITFLAWDLTSGQSSGTSHVDISQSDPVTGSFSVSHSIGLIYIEPVNDSPVIEPGMRLNTIYEDIPVRDNIGTTVTDITDGYYIDVDANSQTGLAIVGVDIRNGTWEYQCPGNMWKPFIGDFIYGVIVPPLPLPEKATLLAGNCRIRFLPNYLFNTEKYLDGTSRPESDTPYLMVRGWDNTGLSSGQSNHYGIDTTYNNLSILNEFSSQTEKVLITIESRNNLPILTIIPNASAETFIVLFTEDDPYVRIVDPPSVSITDVDHVNLQSIKIEIENVYDDDYERIDIVLPANLTGIQLDSANDTITITNGNNTETLELVYSYNIGSSSLTLQSPDDDYKVSIETYVEVLRYLVYINNHTEPVNITRLIRFHVNDSEDVYSNVTTTVEYRLLAENHPILNVDLYYIEFTEGNDSPIELVSVENLTLFDEDHNEFFYISSVEMSILPIPAGPEEYISVNLSAVWSYPITQEYNPATGTLLIEGDAPVGVYQTLLRTSVYHNTIEEPPPGLRNISIIVTDSHGLESNVEYVTINVSVINDREPVILTSSKPFYYIEHHMKSVPMSIPLGNNLTVFDPDSGDLPLDSIIITLINPLNGIEHELLNVTSFSEDVFVDYENSTLTLFGPATVDIFQEILSSLTYINLAEEPIMKERVIELVANDGIYNSSVATIEVIVLLMNDAPVIDLNGPLGIDINYMVEYKEGSGPVSIVNKNELLIYDNDNDYLTQLTVQIEIPFDSPKEILSVENDYTSINVSYDKDTGLLTLIGNATVLEYEDVISSITYNNLEANPGHPNTTMRKILFTAYDIDNSSDIAITYLTFASVNDPPFLDLNGNKIGQNYTVDFTEEGEPVYVTDRNMTLVDIDSRTLSEVKVTILNCLDSDMEVLSIPGSVKPAVTLSGTSKTCQFVISGSGTVEEFREALSHVMYTNMADEPDYTPRYIRVTADDGFNISVAVYTIVNIIPVNDPPRIYIGSGGFIYSTNVDVIIGKAPSVPMADVDVLSSGSGSGSGLDSVSGSSSGLSPDTGSGSSLGSGLGSGNIANTTDSSGSGDMTMEVNITTAEYLTTYKENDPAVPVVQTAFVRIEDDDNDNVVRLQVIIQNVLDPEYEAIFFSEEILDNVPDENTRIALKYVLGGYVQSSCPIGQKHYPVIDLNQTLTLEQMNYTVKSLHYCNSDEDPTAANRTITFRIQDPVGAWSDIKTAVVQVVPINDAPIYSPAPSFDYKINILEDHNASVPILPNFFDYEEILTGNSIVIVKIEPNIGGAIVDITTGSITYTPTHNDYGTRIVYYKVCDSENACSLTENLTIVIEPVNDPPYPIGNLTLEILEDKEYLINLTDHFGDPEDDLDLNITTYPRVTNIELTTTILQWTLVDTERSILTIQSLENAVGTDYLILTVCDSVGTCTNITLTVIILQVNDVPEIIVNNQGGTSFTDEDTSTNISFTLYDIESSIDTPIEFGVSYSGNGDTTIGPISSLTIVPNFDPEIHRRGGLRQEMYITYSPHTNFYGSDIITVYAIDSQDGYFERNVSIMVNYINDPPFFNITSVTTEEDTELVITLPEDLQVTDPEDTLHGGSFSIIQPPLHGNLTYSYNLTYLQVSGNYPPTGVLIYTPDKEFNTLESEEYFIIRACDNDSVIPHNILCTNQTIRVIVESSNDSPVLPPFNVSVYEEHLLVFNLSRNTYDVEDGTPPINLISLIDPLPQYGTVSYNNITGNISYLPQRDFYGFDYIYFQSCDSHGHCNASGKVTVIVLDVNDPPSASSFSHTAIEDDFDLIDIFAFSEDSESDDVDLKISIIDPTTHKPISNNEITTINGARLKIYQIHGIVTYEPPLNFIGYDNFTYQVCDPCDPNRQAELGKVDRDPNCTRQIEVNGLASYTCAEGVVTVTVVNSRDVPVVTNIANITFQGETVTVDPLGHSKYYAPSHLFGYYYSNRSAHVFDQDDYQSLLAQDRGLNLTLFNLQAVTNIDEMSLRGRTQPRNGRLQIVDIGGVRHFEYTPHPGYSGYDSFSYEICDKKINEEPALCSEANATLLVITEGPQISTVRAIPALNFYGNHSDSKVSKRDEIIISFSTDTNMPPHNDMISTLSSYDINMLLKFPQGFIPTGLVSNPYQGQWDTPSQLRITILDEGYPQPESKIGVWTIAVNSSKNCERLSSNQIVTNYDRYCLLTSDTYSIHSTSISPPLSGNWGLRLPDISQIVIRNVDVEDARQTSSTDKLLFENSQIKLLLREPLSYFQLDLYCQMDTSIILDTSNIADEMSLSVVGCENKMRNGENSDEVYAQQIRTARAYFDSFSSTAPSRGKRQTVEVATEQPIVSEITLKIVSFTNLKIDPIRQEAEFIKAIIQGFNRTTLAYVIQQLLGVDISVSLQYESTLPPAVRPSIANLYISHDDDITPQIVSITIDDPSCTSPSYGPGDTVIITFDRDTDQPPVATKINLDKILVFNPPLGTQYSGQWETASILVITVDDIGEGPIFPSTNNFSLTFTGNYFYNGTPVTIGNTEVPTNTPHCIGINVCSTNGSEPTVGICSENKLSCRAYGTRTTIDGGDFSGGERCQPVVSPMDWLWVLIAVIGLVAIVVIVILVYYCYQKRKQKKQREEAMRVVKRWEKDKYDVKKETEKKDESSPWKKPPDVQTMRDQPDPFKDRPDPLKNLPNIVRPPTAADVNLPSLDAIPRTFIPPRAGRPVIPFESQQQRTSVASLNTLTPLGLPRLRQQPTPEITPSIQLAPLKGPLHLYGQRALGDISPEPLPEGGPRMLPGSLLPRQLTPLGGPGLPHAPRLLTVGPPTLPPITELSPKLQSSSDEENVRSTSETDGGTTSDGGVVARPLGALKSPLPSLASLRRPPLPQLSTTSLPPVPTMPSRRVSVDPFAATPIRSPLSPPPLTSRESMSQFNRPATQDRFPGQPLRPPSLPPIQRPETDKT